jgi:hypothetical protein
MERIEEDAGWKPGTGVRSWEQVGGRIWGVGILPGHTRNISASRLLIGCIMRPWQADAEQNRPEKVSASTSQQPLFYSLAWDQTKNFPFIRGFSFEDHPRIVSVSDSLL